MLKKQFNRIELYRNKYFFVETGKYEIYIDEINCVSITHRFFDKNHKLIEIKLFHSYCWGDLSIVDGSLQHVVLQKMTKEFV